VIGLAAVVTAVALLLLVATAIQTGVAAAEDGSRDVVAEAPAAQAEADSDPEANLPYLFAVFFVTWVVFFGFVFVMSRKQREMKREIDVLRSALAERETVAGGPD